MNERYESLCEMVELLQKYCEKDSLPIFNSKDSLPIFNSKDSLLIVLSSFL